MPPLQGQTLGTTQGLGETGLPGGPGGTTTRQGKAERAALAVLSQLLQGGTPLQLGRADAALEVFEPRQHGLAPLEAAIEIGGQGHPEP